MRAAVFEARGEPLRVERGPRSSAGAGRAARARSRQRHLRHRRPLGHDHGAAARQRDGHEFAGEVVEVGREAGEDWRVGDRVCALPLRGCGACRHCLAGDPVQCPQLRYLGMGGDLGGAYAELVRVGCAEAVRLPDAVDYRTGALIEPLAVALHAVKAADVAGRNVLVVGGGPIGSPRRCGVASSARAR